MEKLGHIILGVSVTAALPEVVVDAAVPWVVSPLLPLDAELAAAGLLVARLPLVVAVWKLFAPP